MAPLTLRRLLVAVLLAGAHARATAAAVTPSDLVRRVEDAVTDSVAVYVRPAGWTRVPAVVTARVDGTALLEVEVRGRMGDVVRGARLPLVAVAADAVTSLVERGASGVYAASVTVPPGVSRVVVTSLEGDFQRRIIGALGATARVSWRPGADAVRRAGRHAVDSLPGVHYARQRTATGWRFELPVPREGLPGYVPFVGQVVGLRVFVTDGDGGPAPSELMWSACWPHGPDGLAWRFAELGRLVLVDAPPD